MKFKDAVSGFRKSRLADGYSPNTMIVYCWVYDNLAAFLGNPEVDTITKKDLQGFMYHMRTNYVSNKGHGLSGSSIDNTWKAIRSFFRWASEEFDIERPDLSLPKPKYTQDPVKPFSQDETKKMVEGCLYTREYNIENRAPFRRKRNSGLRDKAMVLFLLDTGIRISEMCRLKVGDINLENGEVRIAPWGTGQKTKARTVYMGKATRGALWRYFTERQVRVDEHAFVSSFENPMDQHTVNHLLHNLGSRVGVEDVHPHRFRHTFAIEYLRNGGDVFTLQRILGHSTITMVMRYVHMADEDDANAHRRASPADRWRL